MKEAEVANKYSREPIASMVAKNMVECDHTVGTDDLKVLKQVGSINQTARGHKIEFGVTCRCFRSRCS